jgi:hypothetical protein
MYKQIPNGQCKVSSFITGRREFLPHRRDMVNLLHHKLPPCWFCNADIRRMVGTEGEVVTMCIPIAAWHCSGLSS